MNLLFDDELKSLWSSLLILEELFAIETEYFRHILTSVDLELEQEEQVGLQV